MPDYYNAYGCGNTCSPSAASDDGKPDVAWIGPHPYICTNTKPAGITDTDKIVHQSVTAGSAIAWGTSVIDVYYPCH